MTDLSNRVVRLSSAARAHAFWPLSAVAVACATVMLTVVRYWVFSDPYPPGLDGAQWLSYGRAMVGGPGRSAEGAYAPFVPILAHGFGFVLGPPLGLRVLAALILVLLGIAVWLLCARTLGVVWGSLATALVLPSTAMAEPFFYGGYPQQASLAFGALGITALVVASQHRRLRSRQPAFAVAAGAFLLSSASHLVFGPLLLASGVLVVLAASNERSDRRQFLLQAAAALAPATAISAFVALDYVSRGYNAPLAASQRTLQAAWGYATRESPVLWAVIVIAGIVGSILVVTRQKTPACRFPSTRSLDEAVLVGFALLAPSGTLLIASGQPRLAPPLLLGGAILFAYVCRVVARARSQVLVALLLTWGAALVWLAGTTTGLTREFASYYQVLDVSLVAAVRSIPTIKTGSVAVAADRRGWPIGWWIEALQERPVFTGSNPQWLAFPEEQLRAGDAAMLFAAQDAQVLRQRAGDLDVAYLVIRKWEWIGWERWIDNSATSPAIIYDDNETIVLEVVPAGP